MAKSIYKSAEGREIIGSHYEAYLQTFSFPIERTYVQTSFGKTHILVAGPEDAKPVFIFQGGNCINPMTLSWFSALAENYRIYAPDTIGHPGYSDETRISAKDDSFARWIKELMDHFQIKHCAFVGPSYGAGIILRLATFMPERIDCSVLVSPAGIRLGSKWKMIKDILVPLMLFHTFSSQKQLERIASAMSDGCMKERDKQIIGDVFLHTRLEQDMPKLTEKEELKNFHAPTLVIAGEKDLFFPEREIKPIAENILKNLVNFQTYQMGHFPSSMHIKKINENILNFFQEHY